MAEAAADIAVSTVLETLLGPIKRHIGYAFESRSKVDELCDETRNLKLERERLLESIEVAQGRGELVNPRFLGWRTEADTAIADAEEVVRNGEETAQKRCSFYLNLKARYRLGKKADQGKQGVVQLLAEKVRLGTVISYIVYRPLEGYEVQSRIRKLKEVMDALLEPNTTMVGLHGMGGIGKTTLAQEIYRKATAKSLFYKVVIAGMTAMPKIRAIQDKIAEVIIESKLEGSSDDDVRASKLNQRLNEILKDKKILIILDDIWSVLDLDKVGIPTDSKGCKILMTSRNLNLLSNMGSKKNFLLEVLSEEESMSLFENKVSVIKFRQIAKEILDRCGGSPLLIVTIAGLLKNRSDDLDVWEDVLTQTKHLDNQVIHNKVYPVLELSYDRLSGSETKLIFLLCSICSWSFLKLTDLLWYSFGLGQHKKYTTISQARRHLKTLIGELQACSLLDIDERGNVRMHDVVQKFAISIACREGFAYRNNDDYELTQWPSGNEISNCTKVSMIWINIENLPESLGCPNVEFLLLFKRGLINIPDSAFQGAKQLKVVHFREVKFASMPRSLYSLENLHTLYLEFCKFPNLDSAIGQLGRLEILSFHGSNLEALPSEVGRLTRLKLLDLNSCRKLEFIPENVISKLTSLEELLIMDSFMNWEIEEHSSGNNARLSELKYLSNLASLEIIVPDVRALPGSFFSMSLERYDIMIGKGPWGRSRDFDFEITKSMAVDFSASIDLLEKARNLLMEAEVMCLRGINGLTNLLDSEGLSKWKELFIRESFTLQQIVDCRTIVYFRELKTLDISDCCKLKSLFSVSAVRSLPQLETINVTRCNQIEALFVIDEESTQVVEFRCLRNLELKFLPKLKCFLDVITSESTKMATTTTKLMSLFNEKVALPSLATLELRSIDNIEMIWSSGASGASGQLNSLIIWGCDKLQTVFRESSTLQQIVDCQTIVYLRELKTLDISDCCKLQSLFSVSAVQSLPQLETINVTRCNQIEAVFVIDEESTEVVEFRCLRNLELKFLPKLKCFLEVITSESTKMATTTTKLMSLFNEKVALPSLETLELRSIHNIEMIWSSGASGASGQLNSLIIWGCDKLQTVFRESSTLQQIVDFHTIVYLRELKTLDISDCCKLKSLFSVSAVRILPQLETINVTRCNQIEAVFVIDEESTEVVEFRCLRNLELKFLPKLKCFLDVITSESTKMATTTTKLMSLFNEKVAVPSLETLELRSIDNIEIIWTSEASGASGQLNSLIIWDCDKLQTVFRESSTLQQIVDCRTVVYFRELKTLDISDFCKLKSLFLVSAIRSLPQLETINITRCNQIEALFVIDEESTQVVEFRCLRNLELKFLPKLKCFLDVITSESTKMATTTTKLMSLFNEKAFPNLEKMSIEGGKFSKSNLNSPSWWIHVPALKTLELYFFRGRSMLELSEVGAFESLPNLRELVVNYSHIEQLWEYKRSSGLDSGLPSIRILKLFLVDGLRHVGRGDPKMEDPLLPFLESIELYQCSDLTSLALSPSASFRNLSTLKLDGCDKMMGLINPSTAQTMVNLLSLDISFCKAIEEIVAAEEDDGKSPTECIIVFNKLKTLKLANLHSLKGFCTSGCFSFNFPCLEEVAILKCSSMRIFCNGDAFMPKLWNINIGGKKHYEVDINTTIKQLLKDGLNSSV